MIRCEDWGKGEEPVGADPEAALDRLMGELRDCASRSGNAIQGVVDERKLRAFLFDSLDEDDLAGVTVGMVEGGVPVKRLLPMSYGIDLGRSLARPIGFGCRELFASPAGIVCPVVTYNSTFIIEGQHRWAQAYMVNLDARIAAINFTNGNNPLRALSRFRDATCSAAAEPSSLTSVYDLGEDEVRRYVEGNITQACVEDICREKGFEGEGEAVKHIVANAMELIRFSIPYAPKPSSR